jgi:hypothetical protein
MFRAVIAAVPCRWAAVVIVLVLAGCANTIRVSQQEIQQQIDSHLPAGTPTGSPITLSLQSLQCELLTADAALGSSDNVALLAQVRVGLLGFLQLDSSAGLQGRLVYNRDRGAFFIEQPQLTSLDVGQVPPQQQQQIMTNLQQLVAAVLAKMPLYALDERMRNHVDEVEVQDNVMLIHLKP